MEKKCKKAKWLSGEALQIAVKRREEKGKGEKGRYTHVNAEFQRIARRQKKAFLSDRCKEIEENNRMGKTRDLFKKIRHTKGKFHVNMSKIKERKCMKSHWTELNWLYEMFVYFWRLIHCWLLLFQIFSPILRVVFSSVLLMFCFAVQKLLSLIRSHLFTYIFIFITQEVFHTSLIHFEFSFMVLGSVLISFFYISCPVPVFPPIFIPSCASSSPAFLMMYSAYKLNKQGDNIQPDKFLSNLEPVHCSMSSPNCCFLTCKQISQETDQVAWYSHLLEEFSTVCLISGAWDCDFI